MTFEWILTGVSAVLITIYLVYAMLVPEKF